MFTYQSRQQWKGSNPYTCKLIQEPTKQTKESKIVPRFLSNLLHRRTSPLWAICWRTGIQWRQRLPIGQGLTCLATFWISWTHFQLQKVAMDKWLEIWESRVCQEKVALVNLWKSFVLRYSFWWRHSIRSDIVVGIIAFVTVLSLFSLHELLSDIVSGWTDALMEIAPFLLASPCTNSQSSSVSIAFCCLAPWPPWHEMTHNGYGIYSLLHLFLSSFIVFFFPSLFLCVVILLCILLYTFNIVVMVKRIYWLMLF